MKQQPNTIKFKRVGGAGECSMDGTMRCNQEQMNAIMEILLRKAPKNADRAAMAAAEGVTK